MMHDVAISKSSKETIQRHDGQKVFSEAGQCSRRKGTKFSSSYLL